MSSRLKKRIIESLKFAVSLFMVFAIIHKFFLPREDWLAFSIIWSISWTVGRFTSQCINTLKKSKCSNLLITVRIIVDAILVIMGVFLEVTAWKEIVINIIIPFDIALILNNTLLKND